MKKVEERRETEAEGEEERAVGKGIEEKVEKK